MLWISLRNVRRAGASAAACALLGLLLAPPVFAAPPPNDAFANAQTLAGAAVAVNGSNVDATLEPGERPPFDGSRSVWYSWTAPAAGRYTADTCTSEFDTVLGVYTGAAVAGLTVLGESDDACGAGSRVRFTAAAGTTYRIAVAGFGGDQGPFRLAIAELHPPGNDDFAAARPVGGPLPLTVSGTTQDAGREETEPSDHGDQSVWYSWTAPATGAYRIETCGSATDAVPALYSGTTLASLVSRTPYEFDSWPCASGPGRSFVARATAGEALRIGVGVWDVAGAGPFTLRISTEPAPANDAFGAAQPVSGSRWQVNGIAAAASSEPGEPAHGGRPAQRTVWMRWTAPASDRYVLQVGGNVTTGLYTGSSLTALTQVPQSSSSAEDGVVTFAATAGTEYRIAVNWSEFEEYPTGGAFYVGVFEGGLAISPTALQFAPQSVNTISPPSFVTFRPSEEGLAGPPLNVSVGGRDAVDFLIAGDACSNPAPECTIGVRFAPAATGVRSAALVVQTWAGPYTVPLSGTGAQLAGAPVQPPSTPAPAAAGKATCRLVRNTRRRAIVRCAVTRTPSANGTVSGALARGKATKAKGTAKLRAGKATVVFKSRRKLRPGRYRVSLSIAVRGQRPLPLTRTIRVR